MFSLCAPTLIYIAFSLTQIVIDIFKGFYNTAFFKFIVMIIISILLNALCSSGMTIISWFIVFIPFIFMSVIVAILLYVFGLDMATGTLNFKCDETTNGNLVFDSSTYDDDDEDDDEDDEDDDEDDNDDDDDDDDDNNNYDDILNFPPYGSSDPQYE
jgi:predicted membrane protein